ncbi:MAG TPA: Xaa-Pro peptidase family protein [Gemmatimonadales bacterium]|nr:Xaa-Pro peptidase family protein [Gemmatimonadales bacterium]
MAPPPNPAIPLSDVQAPLLGPEVFARRQERLRQELITRKLDLFVAAPSVNFQYFTGYNPGRNERLIALFLPVKGAPVVVCPSFEVERLRRNTAVPDIRGWEEQDDPWKLVRRALGEMKPQHGRGELALEHTFDYASYVRLGDVAGGDWHVQTAQPVTERLRIIKYPEEIALIRQAIAITEASIAATFAALQAGLTEQEVAERLSDAMRSRGAAGGGLVQFGPSSALPHSHPGGLRLEREMVVLIDAGSPVQGYASDITRTIWWGDSPSEEFKKVFNTVHDAQTAAMQLGKPFTTRCQEMDRTARKVIADAGYGEFFTHRLGHGMGMDGHEVPYLVEGNETRLEPGMVFTIEPGIYQPGKFGVRIEDDCLMTDTGLEVLSHRVAKL